MNLVVIDKCTNYCAYCFASTEMARSDKRTALSRDDVERVVEFVRRSGPAFDLNVIGGEPFLYADLPFLLELLCAEPAFGTATIFTGGIFSRNALSAIKAFAARTTLLFNLNERRDYQRAADYEVVLRNMGAAFEAGFSVAIGFNIWRPDFDYDEILAACREFGVERLRWTVAYPEAEPAPGVVVLRPEEYDGVARRCAAFLEAAYRSDIEAYLDCPLPKCFFTAEELGRIVLTHPRSATAIRACGPVIDVAPDLSVFRCYALSGHARRALTDFSNYAELVRWYEGAVDDRYARPTLYDRCESCSFADDRSCFGGCMAHNVGSLGARRPVGEFLMEAHRALAESRLGDAETLLRQVPGKGAASSLLWAYVALAKGERAESRRWARLTINRAQSEGFRAKARSLLEGIAEPQPAPAPRRLPVL